MRGRARDSEYAHHLKECDGQIKLSSALDRRKAMAKKQRQKREQDVVSGGPPSNAEKLRMSGGGY